MSCLNLAKEHESFKKIEFFISMKMFCSFKMKFARRSVLSVLYAEYQHYVLN